MIAEPVGRRLGVVAMLAAAAGVVLGGAGSGGDGAFAPQVLRIDGERLIANLQRLATFGATPEGGTSRLAYSEEDLAARRFVAELMEAAGLEVSVDLAGNLIGRRVGADPSLPPIMLGSHIDSVPDGGNYDGQVGSIGALEVAQTLADAGVVTRHPLEIVIFQNEEGGKTGSRVLIGEVEAYELDVVTASGLTIGDGTRALGGDPTRLAEARRQPGSIAAFLELHIEQGAVLQRQGIDIGVVEGIVGIKRWNVTVRGFANHAGTTPMEARRDALVAAARFILAVEQVASSMSGRQVATVGRLAVSPGAPNVIPGEVALSLEIRDLEMDKIDAVRAAIGERAETIAANSGVTISFEPFYVSYAAPTDQRLRELIAESAAELGLTSLAMPSGAGHDAQSIAVIAPAGMIFVPSIDGISHSPREHSEPAAIIAGANVLLRTLLRLDAEGLER